MGSSIIPVLKLNHECGKWREKKDHEEPKEHCDLDSRSEFLQK